MPEPEPIVTEYLGRVAGAALLLAAGTALLVVGVRDLLATVDSGAALDAVAGSLVEAGFVIAVGWLLALAGALTAAGVVLAAR